MRPVPALAATAAVAAAPVLLPAGAVAWAGRRMLTREVALCAAPGELPSTALVLGAEVWPSGQPSRYLRGRLELAAELYRAGLVEQLLLSGSAGQGHLDEPAAMRRWLEERGVDPADILDDPAGYDTYDSCRRARDVYGLEALTVVSQSFHVPRALLICRALRMRAVGVGDDSVRDAHWRRFRLRELGANVKMLYDLGTRRQPTHPEP